MQTRSHRTSHKAMACLLSGVLCAAMLLSVLFATGNGTVAADPSATPVRHAPDAIVTYHDGVMNGQGLQNVKDGNLTNAYVSEDAPDLSDGKQFIQFVWDEPIAFDQVVLYSQYCGTDSTAGQAPTAFDIQVSENGADGWILAASSGAIAWEAGDEVQFHTVQLDRLTGVKGVRVVITDANLDWNHYAVNEVEINDSGAAEDPDPTSPPSEGPTTSVTPPLEEPTTTAEPTRPAQTVYHAPDATVSYNDGVMSGQGLQNIKDGSLTTDAYVSEDSPDLSDGKQYFQFTWEEAIDFNQVVLYSQYCGTGSTEGQAPTAFDIYVSENGVDGWTKTASSGTLTWDAGDDAQSRAVNIDRVTGVRGVRVVITDANLDWGHYAVYELEINDAPETSVPSPDTGEDGRTLLLIGVMACALAAALWAAHGSKRAKDALR